MGLLLLRWALAVFALRFGVGFGHFGSGLRDGMIVVVVVVGFGVASVGPWL
jgi:hypothetical protein